MEIVVATNNRNKLEEIRRMLEGTGHTLLSLGDVGVTSEPEEDGETFAENATLKARAACAASGKAALADDSGLEVDYMGGGPGVRSARFAGDPPDDAANNKRLLGYLTRASYAQRGAHFVCVMVLALPDGRTLQTEGRLDGIIGFAASGDNGFGYDPLFYVGGRSLADMTAEEKDAISHRSIAMRRLREELPAFLGGAAAPAAPAEAAPAPAAEAPPAGEGAPAPEPPPEAGPAPAGEAEAPAAEEAPQ